jgi:hypothetical protein
MAQFLAAQIRENSSLQFEPRITSIKDMVFSPAGMYYNGKTRKAGVECGWIKESLWSQGAVKESGGILL